MGLYSYITMDRLQTLVYFVYGWFWKILNPWNVLKIRTRPDVNWLRQRHSVFYSKQEQAAALEDMMTMMLMICQFISEYF